MRRVDPDGGREASSAGTPAGGAPGWARPSIVAPVLLALAGALSYVYAGHHLPGADEGALLTNAAKLLRGGVFYRDVDAYPFPLAPYLLASAFDLFGEHLSVARALAGLVYCATLLALYAIALHLMDRPRAALFGASLLAFKFLAYPSFTAYTYWDLSFGFACVAIWLLAGHRFQGPNARLALAGLAVGLSLVAKQSVGIYLAFLAGGVLLLPELLLGVNHARPRQRWAELAVFGGASAVPFAGMALYFAAHGLLPDMLWSGLLAPFASYVGTSSVPFGVPLAWWKLGSLMEYAGIAYQPDLVWQILSRDQLAGGTSPLHWRLLELYARVLYTSVPIAFLGVAWLRLRRGGPGADRALAIVGVLALAPVLSAFPRADHAHVISVYPLVALVLFALSARIPRWRAAIWRTQVVAVAALLALCAWLASVNFGHLSQRVELERAAVWTYPEAWTPSVVRFLDQELEAGEPFFVYGQEAEYYFLTGRFFPWRFAQLYPGQTGDDEGRQLVDLLRHVQPRIILRGMMGWPGLPSVPEYVPRLDQYIGRAFRVETRVFERFPLSAGAEPPPWWVFSALRPCEAPLWRCDSWRDFAARQPPIQ